jgi:hypothetical protein
MALVIVVKSVCKLKWKNGLVIHNTGKVITLKLLSIGELNKAKQQKRDIIILIRVRVYIRIIATRKQVRVKLGKPLIMPLNMALFQELALKYAK